MPSPTCTVNATATTNGVNVSAASTITIALADTADVRSWSITCVGRDEAASAPTLTVDTVTKTATFTSGAVGSAYIFRSLVNGGVDQNGVAQASYATTFAVYVLTAGGDRVMALGEGVEGSASFGWISQINAAIRKVSGGDTTLDELTLTGDILIHKDNATPAISQAAKTATASAQAGTTWTWTLQNAIAGTSNVGAAVGGSIEVNLGDAARLTSGNADGGGITWNLGAGVGSGYTGVFAITAGSSAGSILRVNDSFGSNVFIVDDAGINLSRNTFLWSTCQLAYNGDWELIRDYNDDWMTGLKGTVQTVDATPTAVLTVDPLADGVTNRVGVLHVTGTSRRTSDNAVRVFEFKVPFKSVAGTVTLGVQQLLGTAGDLDAAMATVAMTAVVSASNIVIQVTGIAATIVSSCFVKMTSQSWS
jgi:hypothetical protein